MKTTLTTKELHLKRKSMWDSSMANHAKYLNESTGLFHDKFLELRSCPTCDSENNRLIFYKSGGTYVTCNDCEMVFLNPVFKNSEIESYYRNNHDLQSVIVAEDFGFYRELYLKGLNILKNHYSANVNRTILDIGCSAGGFLNIAKEEGWKTHGLEFNRQEAKFARDKGHEVFETDLKKFTEQHNLKFDAITLWDVFEHIKDGRELMEYASLSLNKGGGLFIQSPTPSALAARILQDKCNMFDGIEHVNLYTLENIAALAKKTGFTIENYSTVISEKGVINNYLNYQDPYLGSATKSFHKYLETDEYILGNNLGYKFQIYLKKN
jgi:2-polyprenyl-3-methyl-5-hydroxy-6-metoxy-1,4-benzoquinol methylase/ribosomal protein S27E